MCVLLFAGCENEQKVLYRSNSVEVIREGNKTAVYDLLTDNEYNYKTVRVKRSDGVVEAYTAVDTDTIKIEVLPSATLRIYDKSAEKVITIRRWKFNVKLKSNTDKLSSNCRGNRWWTGGSGDEAVKIDVSDIDFSFDDINLDTLFDDFEIDLSFDDMDFDFNIEIPSDFSLNSEGTERKSRLNNERTKKKYKL